MTKVVRDVPYGLQQLNEAPDRSLKSIAMDFITDLPKSKGYDTLLVFIDQLTKMTHFIKCSKDLDAWQFANLFIKGIVRLHGLPHIHHHRQRDTIHLRRMEGNYGEIRNRTKNPHCFPPTDRRADRTDQCHNGTIPEGIHQLSTRLLVWLPTTCSICVKQRISGDNQKHTFHCQLPN